MQKTEHDIIGKIDDFMRIINENKNSMSKLFEESYMIELHPPTELSAEHSEVQ